MERARSTVQPELDEESSGTDAPIPNSMVTATADPRDLQYRTGSQSISQWARKNIGDNHKEKKIYAMTPKRQSTRLKERSVRSDVTTEDENSSLRTSSDNDNDGDDTGGGTASLAVQGGAPLFLHGRPVHTLHPR
jgi:hypothetical protein